MPPRLPPAEVIVDETPSSGQFNMAMDAALLEMGMGRSESVVRIYEWSEPTVTLGYFQATSVPEKAPFPGIPSVRRLTGGGAILHDRELTYSCVVPAEHPVRENASDLYVMVHQALIGLLQQCGVNCCLRSEYNAIQIKSADAIDVQKIQDSSAEPFLCFLRTNPNDIVHSSGVKIVGSAQRRRKGVTLQHGSILLAASPLEPSLPGISDLNPSFDVRRFRRDLPGRIAESLAGQWSARSYSPTERALSERMAESVILANPFQESRKGPI
jgi:lipoate-protein ligase A